MSKLTTHPMITAEQRLRATPVRMRPLAFYQQPLPCSDRPRALAAARRYEESNQAWRGAVQAETDAAVKDDRPRLQAHAVRVAALDELRELGGNAMVDFVCHAGRLSRDLEAAREGSLGEYHISWHMLAGQYAALSLHTFGEIYWQTAP